MNKLKLALAIASAMTLSACGGGGGGGSSSLSGSSASVSGVASKGIVIGGQVSAFLFGENGQPEAEAIDTAITDENGEYALSIPSEHNGKPLFIKIESTDTSVMLCDIVGGCDADSNPDTTDDITPFGERFDIGAVGLEMSAVLPESSEQVSVNLTPLTTVAADLALDNIENGGAVVNAFNIQNAIGVANSQVANRFGLMGDITEIPVVDLTDPVKVAEIAATDAGEQAIQAAAIGAAIVSAVQETEGSGTTINEAIETFANDFVSNGLIDTADETTETFTDYSEILTDAQQVLEAVDESVRLEFGEDSDALGDLADATQEITNEQNGLDETPTTTGEQGDASPTANAENLAQVKAFVEELRELGTVIEGSVIGEGEQSQTVQALLDDFDIQLDAADMASSDDLDLALTGLSDALGSMSLVYENNFSLEDGLLVLDAQGNYRDGYSDQDFPNASLTALPATIEQDGILVSVAPLSGGNAELSVDASVSVENDLGELVTVDVDVVAKVNELSNDLDETREENYNEETQTFTWSDQGQGDGALDLDILGDASFGSIRIALNEGSSVVADASLEFAGRGSDTSTESGYSEESEDYLDAFIPNFKLVLDTTIEQTLAGEGQTDGAMTFNGLLSAEVNSLRFIEDTEDSYEESYNPSFTFSETDREDISIRAGVVALELTGSFANDETSFEASFTLDGDASGILFRDIYEFSAAYTSENGYGSSSSNESVSGETETNWADVSAQLMFSADLAGISNEAEIDFVLDVERTGFDDFDLSLSLSYPGRTIIISSEVEGTESDAASGELTLRNNDGVVITVTGQETGSGQDDDFDVEIRKDTNGDGNVDEDDFLYAEKQTRNGIDLLVFADDKDSDNIEFQSLF